MMEKGDQPHPANDDWSDSSFEVSEIPSNVTVASCDTLPVLTKHSGKDRPVYQGLG